MAPSLSAIVVDSYPDLPRQGPEPDGDTVKFLPDTPALVETLPRPSGRPPDIGPRGISVRFEAIDALETHFGDTHQELAGGNAARDAMLAKLGFTNVVFFPDLPNKIQSADQDSIRGHVLANGIDANGRLIAFVYPGDHPGPDGLVVFVDTTLVDRSVNAGLLAEGHAYPAFYATLPAELRTHLAGVSTTARTVDPPAGLWPRATADPDGPATVTGLASLEQLVIWPKLFRRVVSYLAAGNVGFDAFDSWLRADPVHRDDALFLLDKEENGNLHDVVEGEGQQLQLTVWPERFIISPDPAAPGTVTKPSRFVAGDVVVAAALPDPAGADQGLETVTLLNTTAATVDLVGWGLADAAGGRMALDGSITAGGVVQLRLDGAVQLGNRGDSLVLLNPEGTPIDQVSYKAEQVRTGRTIFFGR